MTTSVRYIGGSMNGYAETFKKDTMNNGRILRVPRLVNIGAVNLQPAQITEATMFIEEYQCKKWHNPMGTVYWVAFYLGDNYEV